MASKKYISLSKLSIFLDNLKDTFALSTHSHTLSNITDYVVDSQLSSTSNNPVANSVLDAEFEAISKALDIYEQTLDEKVDTSELTNYYTKTEIDNMEFVTIADIDSICGVV